LAELQTLSSDVFRVVLSLLIMNVKPLSTIHVCFYPCIHTWIVIYVDNPQGSQGQGSVVKLVSGSRVRSFNAAATPCVGDAILVVIIKISVIFLNRSSVEDVALFFVFWTWSFWPDESCAWLDHVVLWWFGWLIWL